MLVTDIGHELCWWQLKDVGDNYKMTVSAILVTNIHYL